MTVPVDGKVADAVNNHWADRLTPLWMRPYLRLARFERPIGSWLLFLPCLWSCLLAALSGAPLATSVWHALLMGIGTLAMRGAGCTYNDIVDRDIDAQVERTRSRPLPSGQVSAKQAAVFLVAQALVGLIVLLQFNAFAIWTGLASLGVVAIYPFMKRITHWPQSVLGLAFSWGALMGFAAGLGELPPAAFALYAGAILWVIGYDTIYAHQDREDDAIVGMKSTALLFGEKTPLILLFFYGGAVLLIAESVQLSGGGFFAWAGLLAFAGHLLWQVNRLDIADPALCLKLFQSNRDAGLMLALGLFIQAALQA